MYRLALLFLCLAAATASPTGAASAQTAFCADLLRQFAVAASASSGSGGASPEAVARRLTKQQSAARSKGCAGFNPGGRASPECPGILSSIRHLQAELANAQAAANGTRSGGPSAATLRQRLARNGCADPLPQVAQGDGTGIGAGRTLCVRVCDGYYFPISNISRRDKIKVDEEACQSMYAAAGEAELFVQHRGGDVAMATSINGKLRYAEKPYAFAFRQVFHPPCQGQLKSGIAALGARYMTALLALPPRLVALAEPAAGPSLWPSPRLRDSAVGEDPETVAVRAGGLVDAFRPRAEDAATAGIRHVGEIWYAGLHDPDRPPDPVRKYRPPIGFDLIGSAMAARATNVAAEMATQ